jgi:hypothetical protein
VIIVIPFIPSQVTSFFYKEKLKEGMLMMLGLWRTGLSTLPPFLPTRRALWVFPGELGSDSAPAKKYVQYQYIRSVFQIQISTAIASPVPLLSVFPSRVTTPRTEGYV